MGAAQLQMAGGHLWETGGFVRRKFNRFRSLKPASFNIAKFLFGAVLIMRVTLFSGLP